MTEPTKTIASPNRRFALWQGAAALSTLALVPLATGAMATVDTATTNEISRFMDVFLEVRSNYVEPVDDSKLIEGAFNGMLASLDPHSGYLDARGFSNLRTQTDGEYGGLGLSGAMGDGGGEGGAPAAPPPAGQARGQGRDQGRRLYHPYQQGTDLRADARRSGRPDARQAGHQDRHHRRARRPGQADRIFADPRNHRPEAGEMGSEGRRRRADRQQLLRRRDHPPPGRDDGGRKIAR